MEQQIEILIQKVQQLDGAINALHQENQTQRETIHRLQNRPTQDQDPFKIPDPIKGLPTFDGNKKQLAGWLSSAKKTLALFAAGYTAQQQEVFLQGVLNKITGPARDIICVAGELRTFEDVEQALTHALGDKKEIAQYKSTLWTLKMSDKTDIHNYYKKTCESVQCIKNLARSKTLYATHWEAIDQFIEEDALAAFLTGLAKPYFGYAQSAKPKDVREAYAFLCQFTGNEIVRDHTKTGPKPPGQYGQSEQRPFSKNPPRNDQPPSPPPR